MGVTLLATITSIVAFPLAFAQLLSTIRKIRHDAAARKAAVPQHLRLEVTYPGGRRKRIVVDPKTRAGEVAAEVGIEQITRARDLERHAH